MHNFIKFREIYLMTIMYRIYSVFIFFGRLNTTTLAAQEVKMAPKEFIFSWQKPMVINMIFQLPII